MCNKAVDAFPQTLKFVPDWFVTSKIIKTFSDDLFSNDDIIYVNKSLYHVTFLVMKFVLLIYILMILTMMMLILMKMILKLLFMLHLWLRVIHSNDVKNLKKI